ncbi:MAG: hypothetical protein JSV52_01945 [Candidatus Zixiibacteriota bacterium]|nr:MAG: hypothetical protein JSV52_01945 [candidate division Zixibacteria bacterium]
MQNVNLEPLVALGLTNSEAEIYTYLLENSPSTGYGIAKGIGKQAANTYKALESLGSKGAVIIEDSRTRLCRAVAVDELLANFQRRFESLRDQAGRELKRLKPSPQDNRIYQLQTRELVISKFREMLGKCQRVAMLDLFPWALEQLRDDILSAAERGVCVTVKTYETCQLPGVEVIMGPNREAILEKWPGQWVNGIVDGKEYLLAFLSRDGCEVHQALWSNSHYLGCVYYQGLIYEFLATEIASVIDNDCDPKKLKRILKRYRKLLDLEATGYGDILSYFN